MAETCSDTLYDVTIDALSESDDDGNVGNECDNDFNPYIARKKYRKLCAVWWLRMWE